MKIYRYQNTNNFLAGGLSELKLFHYYDSPRLVRYFDHYQQQLVDSSCFEMPVNPALGDYSPNELQQYNLKNQYFEITIRPSVPFYSDSNLTDKYNLEKRQDTSLECQFLSYTFRREDHIRTIEYPSIFVYLNIPYEFLRDNLSTQKRGADLNKVYNELQDVDLSDFVAVLKAFSRGDKKYGEESNWRTGVAPDMITTADKFGFGYPVMNGDIQMALFNGSHRLSVSPLVSRDFPLLQVMPREYKRGKDRSFFITTPPYFNDNQMALIEIDIDRKTVGGWFIHKSNADFGHIKDTNYIVTQPVKDSRILKRVKSLSYDFKFVF